MGAILSRIRNTNNPTDIFIDFEHHTPPQHDQASQYQTYEKVQAVLDRKQEILNMLTNYKPCTEAIRAALSTPSPQIELHAFNTLLPAVHTIHQFVVYSQQIETVTPQLLHVLSVQKSETTQSFNDQQSLAYQLCDLFNFILLFDILRIQTPQLSNDFSFYRRIVSKFSNDPRIELTDEMMSSISQWCMLTCPMLSSVSKSASLTLQSNQHVPTALSTIANTCRQLIECNKFERYETNLFCIRSCVTSIVLYDHIDPVGAFSKNNPCQTKQVVRLIRERFGKETGLLNAIQYSSKHFNTASPKMQALFQ